VSSAGYNIEQSSCGRLQYGKPNLLLQYPSQGANGLENLNFARGASFVRLSSPRTERYLSDTVRRFTAMFRIFTNLVPAAFRACAHLRDRICRSDPHSGSISVRSPGARSALDSMNSKKRTRWSVECGCPLHQFPDRLCTSRDY
jgi:hypothetical protein